MTKRKREEEANIGKLMKTLPHEIRQNILDRLDPIELHSSYFFYGVPNHNEMVKKHLDNRWYGMAHRMLNDIKSDVETYHMVILETPLNNKSIPEYGDSHYVILTKAMEKMKELGFPRSMELFEKLILHNYDHATTVELYKDMVRECNGTVKPEVYRAVLNVMIDRDIQEAIKIAMSLLSKGIQFDMSSLVRELVHKDRIKDVERILEVSKGIQFDMSYLVRELVRKDKIKDVERILEAFGECEPVFIETLVKLSSKVEAWECAYNLVDENAKLRSPKTDQLLKAFVSSIWDRKKSLLLSYQQFKYNTWEFHNKDMWQLHMLEKCFEIVTIIGKVPDKDTCVAITCALQKCGKEEEAMFMFQRGVCEPGIKSYNDLKEWVRRSFC